MGKMNRLAPRYADAHRGAGIRSSKPRACLFGASPPFTFTGNFTYKAIEFGSRGRVPNFTMEIVGNRYGDCKDHSLLFYQLLRAIDEPAELVLVSTDNEP